MVASATVVGVVAIGGDGAAPTPRVPSATRAWADGRGDLIVDQARVTPVVTAERRRLYRDTRSRAVVGYGRVKRSGMRVNRVWLIKTGNPVHPGF